MIDEANSEAEEEVFAFPASVQQRAFWFLHALSPDVGTLNVPLRFELEGPLDVEVLKTGFEKLFERHEVLRTSFEEDEGELLQVVHPVAGLNLPLEDLRDLDDAQRDAEVERLSRIESEQPFDLAEPPLLRMRLLRVADDRHVLCFTVHHTVFDGWSINLLTEEVAAIYSAELAGSGEIPEPPGLQYADFSVWQRDFLEGPEIEKQIDFWTRKLEGMSEPQLMTDRPRPRVKSWSGTVESVGVPSDLADRLRSFASSQGFTPFHVLLSAFKLLLLRYTGGEDIAVGTPATGRTRADLDPIIGVFVNPMVLRTDLAGDPTFLELCDRVRGTVVDSLDNQDLPFENIVEKLEPSRDPGRNPLFQINFTYEGAFGIEKEFSGLTWRPMSMLTPGVIFDLHLFVVESADGWKLNAEYSEDLFDNGTIRRMLDHLLRLLEQAVEHPNRPTHEIELLSADERRLIVDEWSGRKRAHEERLSVAERFDSIARRFSDRTALISEAGRLSYAELVTWVATASRHLGENGVTAGTRVACCFPPSVDAVVAILAILRVGGCYIPLDPSDPAARREALLRGSEASHLLVGGTDLDVGNWSGQSVVLPSLASADPDAIGPCEPVDPEGAAYRMFTSGSTGLPKAVEVPHRAITRLVVDSDFAQIDENEVFLMAAPLSFDASTLEIFGPLLNGGTLVVPQPKPGLAELAAAIQDHGVTTMWLTSGFFEVILDESPETLRGLKQLLVGGDVLSRSHIGRALEILPGTQLINGYGPTENTTFTTCHPIESGDIKAGSIPIGRPIRGTSVYILDSRGQPVPAGVPGMLFTGGDGLALGYPNDAELTAERFQEHPEFGLLYATGDRCRWRADGSIEFLGRGDHQVKLRGFRIEPGEIESALAGHPHVSRCKVAVRGEGAGGKRLLAWVCPTDGFDSAEASEWLSQRLPTFMIPDRIIEIKEMPLNANGKVAVAQLPEPDDETLSDRPRREPEGDIETALAAIWTELLGGVQPGRDDDFFDIGGNSLAGLRMFSRIQNKFGVSLPLATLLKARTIRLLGVAIEASESTSTTPGRGQLAAVQPQGDEPPFCAIHGGDGGILFYRQLAERLPKDRPFLAIESPDLGSDRKIDVGTIEETAERYIDMLRSDRPHGPYLLAGYSYGGVVAFEMARQLVEAGEEVPFLALFDTVNPGLDVRPYALGERVSVYWNSQSEAALGERILRLAGRFKDGVETHLRVKAESAAAKGSVAEAHTEQRAVQLREAHEAAMDAYRPSHFRGTLHLFRASAVNDKFEIPDDYGWSERVDDLKVIEVSGEHLTLFDDGNVGPLAEDVSAALRAAIGERVDQTH